MSRIAVLLVSLLGTLSVALGYVVAADDSGKYLSAASATQIIVSTDYGSTWNATLGAGTWSQLTSDGSGKNLALVATCNSGGSCITPFLSKNGGLTWTTASSAPYDNWYSVASDGTGNKLAAAGGSNVYLSNDGGSSWLAASLSQGYTGTGVAYSADATKIVYSYMNYISMHVNGIWEETPSPSARWGSLGTDTTGTVIAGAYDIGYYSGGNHDKGVYISVNGGFAYSAIVVSTTEVFYGLSVNDDGTYVFYGGTGGLYVYNVAKKTIAKSDFPSSSTNIVYSIASSKTGKYVVASSSANIWVSSNYGVNFKLVK